MSYENISLYKNKKNITQIEKLIDIKEIVDNDINNKIYEENFIDINKLKKYFEIINYKYDLSAIKENFKLNKLICSVNTTNEAIRKIISIDLFKCININSKINKKTKLNIPLQFKYCQIESSDYNKFKEKFENVSDENIYVLESNENKSILEIYISEDLLYNIYFSTERDEYYLAVYNSLDDEAPYKKYNIIDIYTLLANTSRKNAIVELINLLDITVINIDDEIKKYKNNLEILTNEIVNYAGLYKLIKKHIYVLEEIIKIGLIECYFYNEDKQFNLSLRYLGNRLNKSNSTICSIINGFILLGFCNKNLMENKSKVKNAKALYSINIFSKELLEEADIIANKMSSSKPKLTISNINYKNIESLFGEEIANSVILDSNIKRKIKLNA